MLSSNLVAIRTLAAVGESLAGKGHQLALASDSFRYGIAGPFLVAPVTHALTSLQRQLGPARTDVIRASGIADNLPGLLGLYGTRRYFLAFQTDMPSHGPPAG